VSRSQTLLGIEEKKKSSPLSQTRAAPNHPQGKTGLGGTRGRFKGWGVIKKNEKTRAVPNKKTLFFRIPGKVFETRGEGPRPRPFSG